MCAQDASLKPLEVEPDLKTHRTPWPSVLNIQDNSENCLAVSIEAFKGILLYQLENEKFQYLKKVDIEASLWSFLFLRSTEVVMTQADAKRPLMSLKLDDEKPTQITFQEHEDFFKGEFPRRFDFLRSLGASNFVHNFSKFVYILIF